VGVIVEVRKPNKPEINFFIVTPPPDRARKDCRSQPHAQAATNPPSPGCTEPQYGWQEKSRDFWLELFLGIAAKGHRYWPAFAKSLSQRDVEVVFSTLPPPD